MEADLPGRAEDADHLWEPVPPPRPPAARENNNNNNNNEAPPEVVEEANQNADGSLDGGMAVPPGDESRRRSSTECDLVLFLECTENIDASPDHPILQPGVKVSIGLEKSTKLSAVFERYCAFCNENASPPISVSDVEFVHCGLLQGHDTAEASALMKNDVLRVRRVRESERKFERERKQEQLNSDREYFKKLRGLMPDLVGPKNCDVLFDCRGKLVDENGLNQKVLRTFVQGHAAILSKRCAWLGRIIQSARDESERRSVITIPENDGTGAAGSDRESPVASERGDVVADSASPKPRDPAAADEDEDDGIEVLPFPINQRQPEPAGRVVNDDSHESSAAEIENDEDDDQSLSLRQAHQGGDVENRGVSPVMSSSPGSSDMLWVVLPSHSPEAVKLLLEYCYTNRVLPLGLDAFVESCRTMPLPNGNVLPFGTLSWPNNGLPLVSFSVALAGIALSEEASMARLSLMCEVAAAQLVTRSNFVEALSICSVQQARTGNNLPRLREAAIEVVFRHGERGVLDVCRMPTFRKALKERSAVVVPSLLDGTRDAVASTKPKSERPPTSPQSRGSKRHWSGDPFARRYFDQLDKDDSYRREMERRKRRSERRKERGEEDDVGEDDETVYAGNLPLEPPKSLMSLKRMSQRLEALSRSDGNQLGYQALPLGRRGGRSRSGGSKSSNRRRSGRSRGP